jgi:hypothetical protein
MYTFNLNATGFLGLGCYGFMMFVYWTFLEGYRGQFLEKDGLKLSSCGPIWGEHNTQGCCYGELWKGISATV